MKILIILPTYNERGNLEPLLGQVFATVPEAHVLIIDDASPDDTGALADDLAALDSRIRVIHRPAKLGLGTAYLMGFRYALEHDYGLVLEMDADFSHDPSYLPVLIAAAAEADLVLGSRYVPGGNTENWKVWRQWLSQGGCLYARSVLNLQIRDLTGGYKCFRREVLESLPLSEIRSEGYSFQIEVTYRAHLRGFRILEVPIIFRERREGYSKISRTIIFEAAWVVWKLRATLKHAHGNLR